MFRFYAGKGGAGKTTCAAAAALRLAWSGARTLVVSTDPAHSLGDALDLRLAATPRAVGRRLFAAEMNADRALARWVSARERSFRTIAARGTYLDGEDIDALFRLSLPGVDELVGLIELRRLSRGFDEVVVDTAPTGHTLRLLETPETLARLASVLDDLQAKHRALSHALGGWLRRDAEERVIEELAGEGNELRALLRSPGCEFHWVTLAEELSAAEARDGVAFLRGAGLRVARLVANRLTPAPARPCTACATRRFEERQVLRGLRELRLPFAAVFEAGAEPRGAAALLRVGRALERPFSRAAPKGRRPAPRQMRASCEPWLDAIAPRGARLVFFGGKGGVGKTTAAATFALAAARQRGPLLLLSTDPAHSAGDVLQLSLDDEEREVAKGLWARELDAPRAFLQRRESYRAAAGELFASLRSGASIDAPYDRAVVEDLIELSPPGLDEIFALLSVVDALGRHPLVVVDTAPTGHALRLLELLPKARQWVQALLQILLKYRPVTGLGALAADLTATARELRELQDLLVDGARARFVVVTRAAALPALETARLQAALRRLRVARPVLLVNALREPGCPRCNRVAGAERKQVARLRRARRGWAMLGAPLLAPAPRGVAALERFGRTWTRME